MDVGSLSTDVVLLDRKGTVVSWAVLPTGPRGGQTAQLALRTALEKGRVKADKLVRVVATGYGRKMVDLAHRTVTEITCHARGAFFLFSEARTVIDVGGQDSKVIRLDDRGRVGDFVMNDKCAAGTGRFLEVMAQALEVGIEGFAELAARGGKSVAITSTCTVFAESEVISLLAEGVEAKAVAAGLAEAVANRVAGLAQRIGVEPRVIMTGGVAKNRAVVAALERHLGVRVAVPPEPQIVGALGAALIALEEVS
jgi:predicted CoA-substrate-specific enzyme activase